jgi:hypothetical protein
MLQDYYFSPILSSPNLIKSAIAILTKVFRGYAYYNIFNAEGRKGSAELRREKLAGDCIFRQTSGEEEKREGGSYTIISFLPARKPLFL